MLLCGNTWSLSPEIEIACFAELLKDKTLIPNHLKCPITLKLQQFCCFVPFLDIYWLSGHLTSLEFIFLNVSLHKYHLYQIFHLRSKTS